MPSFEQEDRVRLTHSEVSMIAGVDEAGRGPLAGVVSAAAVIFPRDYDASWLQGLNDSKKLAEKKREELFSMITNDDEVIWSISHVSAEEIDRINILQATYVAMSRAVDSLCVQPEFSLVDGRSLPPLPMPSEAIIKGDQKSLSIAAASVLAKVSRDHIMNELDREFPQYGFSKHKGYGTKQHLEALQNYGATVHHRRSFRPVAEVLKSDN